MGQENIWFWLGFLAFVAVLLAIDLGVLNRKAHAVSLKEAALMSVLWISIALLFGVFVTLTLGTRAGVEYYTAWVLEKSLSVDNLFVFVLIFSTFRVPAHLHHRVLFWGILGAIAMRAVLIVAGASLIHQFSWLMLVFGAFLIYTGIKLARAGDDDAPEVENNPLLKVARRFLRITPEYHGEKFFVRLPDLLLYATPLLLVLIVIESTDLVFAVDSIPAVIGVSHDPFVIFTSNVMAILGLRALYFLLAGAVDRFHYLKPALAIILTFVGVKMIAEQLLHPAEGVENVIVLGSLAFILSVLVIAIVASFIRERRQRNGVAQSVMTDPNPAAVKKG
jgi:tellurite resistance protein TerC